MFRTNKTHRWFFRQPATRSQAAVLCPSLISPANFRDPMFCLKEERNSLHWLNISWTEKQQGGFQKPSVPVPFWGPIFSTAEQVGKLRYVNFGDKKLEMTVFKVRSISNEWLNLSAFCPSLNRHERRFGYLKVWSHNRCSALAANKRWSCRMWPDMESKNKRQQSWLPSDISSGPTLAGCTSASINLSGACSQYCLMVINFTSSLILG